MDPQELKSIIESTGKSNYAIEKQLGIPNGYIQRALSGKKPMGEKYEALVLGLKKLMSETETGEIKNLPVEDRELIVEPDDIDVYMDAPKIQYTPITDESYEGPSLTEDDENFYLSNVPIPLSEEDKAYKRPDSSLTDLL